MKLSGLPENVIIFRARQIQDFQDPGTLQGHVVYGSVLVFCMQPWKTHRNIKVLAPEIFFPS